MRQKTFYLDITLVVLLLGLTVLSALYFYPYAMEIPHRDSGIYLYIGSEILDGKTIYVDVWEHKPPFIFYINALGLLIFGGSPWGIWALEVLFLFLTLLLGYLTLRRKLNPIPSLLITTAVFLTTYQYMSGNYTEEYSLLFQAAIIFIFLKDKENRHTFLSYFLIGILTGILFNIKQTYIDVTAAIIILILLEMLLTNKWKNIKLLFGIGVGFLIPNLFVFLVMLFNNALEAWWKTAFVFNFAYSDIGLLEKINAFLNLIKSNSKYPFFVSTGLVWIFGALYFLVTSIPNIAKFLITKKGRLFVFLSGLFFLGLLIVGQFMGTKPGLGVIETAVLSLSIAFLILFIVTSPAITKRLTHRNKTAYDVSSQLEEGKIRPPVLSKPFLLGLINLPIVVVLVVTSGRNYNHYFISFYPAVFLLFFGSYLYFKDLVKNQTQKILFSLIILSLLVWGAIHPVQRLLRGMGGPYQYNPFREVVKYVRDHSEPNDTVLVWGLESGINYLTDRSSPSRYSYVDPAYYESPLRDEARAIILEDVTSNPPLFILDMRNPDYPFIDGKTYEECLILHPIDGTDLDKTINFACKNYIYIDRINGIEVYQLDSHD